MEKKAFLIYVNHTDLGKCGYYVTSTIRSVSQADATVFKSMDDANAAITREGWVNSTSVITGKISAYACENVK